MDNEDDSLPYIDDTTDDETNQYNLKIIENYKNKNRNIEITDASPYDVISKPGSPVAPLAEEDADFYGENKHSVKVSPGMKLVIKSWNSSVSIQGLDNKSFITFRRKPEKMQKRTSRSEERKPKSENEAKLPEKPKKGRWKVLTRSLMLKSARSERRGVDERYPKYVLLKNEEDEPPKTKESYPKMFPFEKQNEHEAKPEFSFKRSFKNKTKPIVPMEEILKENNREIESEMVKRPKKFPERRQSMKKFERRKSLSVEKSAGKQDNTCPQRHVFREIQGIIEDTLKLVPPNECIQQESNNPPRSVECCASPRICQYSCHDPYCSIGHANPSNYRPVYAQQRHANTEPKSIQTCLTDVERDSTDIQNLQFGILSSFFPRVLILKAIQGQNLADDVETTGDESQTEIKKEEEYAKPLETLEVPHQDLRLKSKMVQDVTMTDAEVDFYLGDLNRREDLGSDDDQKTKTDGSDTTEYLHYCELNPGDSESVEGTKVPTERGDEAETLTTGDKTDDETSKTLSLTKIGYKMYDNLTKLSLNREKEIIEKAEASGCGCELNKRKKLPCNITLESNNNVVKVTVPEKELNFQIVNSEGGDILIGVTSGENKNERKEENEEQDEKKIVRRDELWHSDDGKRTLVLRRSQQDENDSAAGPQKVKLSLTDEREVLLSIEMKEKNKKEEKIKPIPTKETKVGTDDFDLAGGDFICTLGDSYRNLSPRTAGLLKSLHEKLKIGEQERKFLEEKINQKITDQKYGNKILPGLFLVKQISPKSRLCQKPPEGARKLKKEDPVRQLREYYCEDCLATMRIFEDANPSVRSMVDKFETIIQLESY